ncbi:MAG: nucleotide sugar dehydrogenase, partial [Actinobacteria bacterium]|nr:nucleotide sugar dehydrogenase [Actinomycetota bacterium]
MKVAVFGAGYVGLVTGACFADLGHEVVVRDVIADRVAALRAGKVPIHEPGLEEVIARAGSRIVFTTDVAEALDGADVLYIAVGTPPTYSGDADLSAVWTVVDDLPQVERRVVVVTKSTVPVGTGEKIRQRLDARGLAHVGYASNPEFTAEGTAVRDFMHPDRIVIGAFRDEDADVVAKLHAGIDAPVVRCDVASAEMIKLAANAALMTRISFINEIANVCEATGADVVRVAEGIGLDRRIGKSFLRAGIGFGGSCLPGGAPVVVEGEGLVELATLFERCCGETDGQDVEVALPLGLQVLAWEPGAPEAEYREVAAITRRRYEGELLGVRHPFGKRVYATPDHPFLVASESDQTVEVRLARDLVPGDLIPNVSVWHLSPTVFRHAPRGSASAT